jgi:hypothetical protein
LWCGRWSASEDEERAQWFVKKSHRRCSRQTDFDWKPLMQQVLRHKPSSENQAFKNQLNWVLRAITRIQWPSYQLSWVY